MYTIQTLNKISPLGLNQLDADGIHRLPTTCENPDGILVRSADMHEYGIPGTALRAIARAGAGTNNIPLGPAAPKPASWCSTPPAPTPTPSRSWSICALMLASRNVVGGIEWVPGLDRGRRRRGQAGGEGQERSSWARRSAARTWASSAWAPSACRWPTSPP